MREESCELMPTSETTGWCRLLTAPPMVSASVAAASAQGNSPPDCMCQWKRRYTAVTARLVTPRLAAMADTLYTICSLQPRSQNVHGASGFRAAPLTHGGRRRLEDALRRGTEQPRPERRADQMQGRESQRANQCGAVQRARIRGHHDRGRLCQRHIDQEASPVPAGPFVAGQQP